MSPNPNLGGIPILRGYDIPADESLEYARNYVSFFESKQLTSDKLVPMLGLFCPNRCNLNCIFCSSSANAPPYPSLSRVLVERLVREGAEIGVKTIEIAAMGEPTLWENLLFLSEWAFKCKMTLVLFSNGQIFSDDELCRQIHGVDSQSFIERLYENGVSVLLKMNSNIEDVYDFMAGTNGAYRRVQIAFSKLIKRGFSASSPTRLGCACVAIKRNATHIIEIWRWARENNIFPFVESLQRIGKADEGVCYEDLRLKEWEILELYRALADVDQKEYGISWKPQLPYAAFPCTVFDHLVVDNNGMVRPCFKFFLDGHVCGNVHRSSLRQIILSSDTLYRIRKRRLQNMFDAICLNRVPEGFEPVPRSTI